jgi:coenzyme PQQ biosynthesis protein PqqD
MMESTDRPKLAARVRVRLDKQTGQHMLLYPERGLALNTTAHAIVTLCTGERTLAEIVDALRMKFAHSRAPSGVAGVDLEADVRAFLGSLAERGLIEMAP